MNLETFIYFFVWTGSVLYSVYCFSSTTFEYFRYYNDDFNDFVVHDLRFLSKRDKADVEWESIIFLMKLYFPYILIYLGISRFIKTYIKNVQVLQIWQILFTISYILIRWNYMFLLVLMFQPVLFYPANHFKLQTFSVWMISGISLVILNYFKSFIEDPEVFENFKIQDIEMYILISSLFWLNLKCTSFCLENSGSVKTLLDMFSYCFYPPTVLTGPFIPYKDFQNNYKAQKCSVLKCENFFRNICRTVFWYFSCYVCLHFVYVNAASYHLQLVENFNGWSLYGFGYTMGQFFHLKYVILYGMSTNIASFENMNVPNLPRCIGRIHLYSDMWKYFDPGVYKFLVRHIYLPLVHITRNKPLRSMICFSFVYVWHGLETHILIWTILNYSGIIFENILWPSEREKPNLKKIKEQSWKRRLDCIMASFLLAMSAISNFYFFAGTEVGNVFAKRIFTDLYGNIILVAVLYCCCQVSTELTSVSASKM